MLCKEFLQGCYRLALFGLAALCFALLLRLLFLAVLCFAGLEGGPHTCCFAWLGCAWLFHTVPAPNGDGIACSSKCVNK